MLTQEELHALLEDIESDRIGRTISTTHTDTFAQAVCAFANDYPHHRQPGYLLIGVDHTPVRLYWFADRIEIQSPGGLYGEVTPDTLTQVSSYRNPVIAECMKALGYVNRFGYGIQRARALLERNGNPPLDFMITPQTVRVIIHRKI